MHVANDDAALASSLNDGFQVFIGIDQTGAASEKGKSAKPFPISFLFKVKDSNNSTSTKWILKVTSSSGERLKLKSLTPDDLTHLLTEVFAENTEISTLERTPPPQLDRQICLFIDGVFGLAESAWPKGHRHGLSGLWQLFRNAQKQKSGYGLRPAAEFFAQLLAASAHVDEKKYPARRCEILANANSVFRTHPYQKNIQCGTFRIWRDLGKFKKPWLNIRFFTQRKDATKNHPWAFEAYPSYLWREIFGLKTRQPKLFAESLRARFPDIHLSDEDEAVIAKYPDWADAAILSLGALALQRKGALFESAPHHFGWLKREGWIIGVSTTTWN